MKRVTFKDVREYYEKGIHGLNHVRRVYENSLIIAGTVNCDVEVVKAAALLHDIARNVDETDTEAESHAIVGARMAEEILEGFNYTSEQKSNIIHCIRVHRYSSSEEAKTIEDGVLQDADRLDSLGAMIIMRNFYQTGKVDGIIHDPSVPPSEEYKGGVHISTAVNHFYEKVLKIKPDTFNTEKGKEMARPRYDFVKEFVEQFLKEWNCEDI